MGATVVRLNEPAVEPTSLRYVGPATAAVIEQAPFDVEDIREARVSHRALVEAGVNAGVAENLRRAHNLLWNFRWHPGGENLPRRAAKMRGASDAERRWIAASAADWNGRLPDVGGNGHPESEPTDIDPEFDGWPDVDELEDVSAGLSSTLGDDRASPSTCPRCDGDLSSFQMGEKQSMQCSSCGYVGVELSSNADAWRRAVDRIVRGEIATAPA